MSMPVRFVLACVAVLVGFTSPAMATDVKEVVSPGGIRAWLVEEHALPLVAVRVAFRDSGAAYDPKDKEGLTAMVAALLMEGAGDMDSHAFNAALENNAIQLNFSTDDDLFRGSVVSLSENKEKAWSYIATALTKPRFDDSAIDRVRRQTLSVIDQQEHEPSYIVRHAWEAAAFGDHPYAHEALGNKTSVSGISKSDMQEFVRHYFARDNMLVAVVGDITPDELSHMLDKHFGALPEHYASDVKIPEVKLPEKASQKVIDNDIPQTMVLFGANALKRDDPDYYAAYVMNDILGGGGALTSKLGIEIREKRGLAYAVYTQANPMVHGAFWRGGFATRNEKVGTALDVLHKTLADFAANGPTDKELADSKSHLTGSFVLGLDSNADIANYLISMQFHHLGRDYLNKRNQYIEAVGKDKVKAIAAKLANPDGLTVVMVGKPDLTVQPVKDTGR